MAARASAPLTLRNAARVASAGVVEVAASPDPAFLRAANTKYPVVVDPEYNFGTYFDTWVQTGYSSDMSGSTELRLGTFDGGADVARSYLNFDVSGIRYKTILDATLNLWEWHSWSCTASEWQVWHTAPADTNTRVYAQPPWWGLQSASSQTRGYSAGCDDGWVNTNLANLAQGWSRDGYTLVGIALKATNEADSNSWKKFSAADAGGGIPTLWVRWNTPPAPATNLSVGPAVRDGATWTGTTTPRLSGMVHDADGSTSAFFTLYNLAGQQVWSAWIPQWANDGQVVSMDVPPGILVDGGQYHFILHTYDGIQWNTDASGWSETFTVDTTAPAAPAVASADYPNDGTWHKGENQPGNFSLTLPAGDPTLAGFEWGLDVSTPTNRLAAGGNATLSVTPPTNGIHVLQVRSIDRAGNRSAVVKYGFNVGRAGLTSPVEGGQVARRVRLSVTGEPVFTYVKFAWRRGPDAATSQDISLADLSRADGKTLASPWASFTELGEYATWDASATLGHVPGPVQVQAIVATDGNGTGAYATPWVTVTVSPDARNASTNSVGPGSVNLLTGDYRLSSTDVHEFGLSVERSASSREPRDGLEPQQEKLSASQQSIAKLDGFGAVNSSISQAVGRGHTGMDSIRVVSGGSSSDNWADVGIASGLRPGATYRATAWVYVPGTTGLAPDMWRGLRVVGFYQDANGSYPEFSSNAPVKTDSWQQLTLDFTVPANVRGWGFIRLYNGFLAPGKEVYFDDLPVREIWAPLGPQWKLGTADQAAGTAYTRISQPSPDAAVLHLSGGGEVWFTSGGNRWWAEPGAQHLTLAPTGDGRWRVTDLDGTVSDFARQPGSTDAQLTVTSPPAAAGATRLVYENADGRVRLARLIAPVEPGVDGWPSNGAACTTAVPAAGCHVIQLTYASATTASSTALGDYTGQVSQVQLWSSPDATSAATQVTAVQYAYDAGGRLREVWDPRITPALKTSYEYDADGRVLGMTPPGELPWKFRFGSGGPPVAVGSGDLIDRSSGRLLSVSRPSLQPGTLDQAGPDTTSTVVYAVPTQRSSGGPYELHPDALASWAQRSGPTDATAIFGPEDTPTVTTATATAPGPDGYRAATVHYLDSSGREVNTATPAGPAAPPEGYIDTTEHDKYGNVVRSLEATDRLLALGKLPSAAADLTTLNLAQADTGTRAMALSTVKTYSADGLDMLRERGPLVRAAVGNDPGNVQLVHHLLTHAYDEGKPDGAAYHLVTTDTEAVLMAGTSPEQLTDVTITKHGYNPIDGASPLGPMSGWVHKGNTSVTVDAAAGGANVTSRVRYDDRGRAVESRQAGSTGSDAGTKLSFYYSAVANPAAPECGGKPGYAGWACKVAVAGPATGHDPARMAAQLPVKTTTAYNRYGSVASVTESATGPVDGASVTQSRTTTTEYDDADRVLSVTMSAQGPGMAQWPRP